jgi:hypothetical protein
MSASASVQNVLDRMIHGVDSSSSKESFYPSSTWQGSKPGYYFGTSDQGTGYYQDQPGKFEPVKKKRSVKIDEGNNEMRLFTTPTSLLEQAEKKASNTTILELTPWTNYFKRTPCCAPSIPTTLRST